MLNVHSVSKSYGIEQILKDVSFTLNARDRFGLVGPNGSGKTTLLRIITHQEKPDSGGFSFDPPGLRAGYLPQGFDLAEPRTAQTIEEYLVQKEGDLPGLTKRLETLAISLTKEPDRPDLQREYDQVLSQIEHVSKEAGRSPAVLSALGLQSLPASTPIAHLSGGQKTRLALAGVLLSNPQLLLLDEPTNHLDFDMLEWLEEWLLAFRGGVLIVSHDRTFLDRTVNGILELDAQRHTLQTYPGNYTQYLEQKVAERERQWQAYSDQQVEITRLKRAATHVREIARFRKGGKADTGDKFAKGFFANRSLETIRRAKQLERRLNDLLTVDRVEKPKQSWQMKLEFEDTPGSGRDVIRMNNLSVGYGSHVLLANLNLVVRYGARVAIVGRNGAGKTTLLRTIAGLIPPVSGNVYLGSGVQAGYMAQEQENLYPEQDALTTIRKIAPLGETEARTFLHRFLFGGDDVFVPVGQLSFGERARLILACLVAQGSNLLLLDEPINHLDIPSRARFEAALGGYEGTILTVVHDRYFIEGFATEIWDAGDGMLSRYEELEV